MIVLIRHTVTLAMITYLISMGHVWSLVPKGIKFHLLEHVNH